LQLEVRRAELLAAGRRIFSEKPYDTLSMDDLARAAGVSKGLLYHYYPSKREFYLAVLRVGAEELSARTDVDKGLAPIERLDAALRAYLGYVEENAAGYAALLRGGMGSDPEVDAIVERTRRTMMRRIVRSIGVTRIGPTIRLALRGWIGFVEAVTLDWLARRDATQDAVVRLLAKALEHTMIVAVGLDPSSKIVLPVPTVRFD
jgi:AcrR family transcriptional regulator